MTEIPTAPSDYHYTFRPRNGLILEVGNLKMSQKNALLSRKPAESLWSGSPYSETRPLSFRSPLDNQHNPHTLTQLVKLPIFKLSRTLRAEKIFWGNYHSWRKCLDFKVKEKKKKKKIQGSSPHVTLLIFTKKMTPLKRRVYIFLYLKQSRLYFLKCCLFVWLTLQAGQIRSARRARCPFWPPFHRVATASQMTSLQLKQKEGKRKEQKGGKERKDGSPGVLRKKTVLRNTEQARSSLSQNLEE